MSITMNTSAFSAALEERRQAVMDAVRPAAQAGTEILYQQARVNCPVSAKEHWFYGSASKAAPKGSKKASAYLFKPGNLRDAIYQAYSKDNSGPSKATYHVSWNHQKAPYGFMVERGTSRAAANPFLEPAIISSRGQVLDAIKTEFVGRVGQ